MVVSREITAARLRRLDRSVQRLRRLAAMPLTAYLGDQDAQALAERHFHIAIQCLLDMANHIVAEQGLGSPEDAEDLFACLAGAAPRPSGRARIWVTAHPAWPACTHRLPPTSTAPAAAAVSL